MEEIRALVEKLDHKIENYENVLLEKEKELLGEPREN